MHILINATSISKITSIYVYMDYYIANRWEVAAAVLCISPTTRLLQITCHIKSECNELRGVINEYI